MGVSQDLVPGFLLESRAVLLLSGSLSRYGAVGSMDAPGSREAGSVEQGAGCGCGYLEVSQPPSSSIQNGTDLGIRRSFGSE